MEKPIHKNEQNLLPSANLIGEIEKLRDDVSAERDHYLHIMADFKNYRRRVERDGSMIAEERKRGMLLPLLDIVDDMEKALQSANGSQQPFVQGVRSIYQKFLSMLEAYGVRPFESAGMPFDYNFHEAVATVKQKGSDPGIVVNELRRGYLLNNEMLRTAQVRVAE